MEENSKQQEDYQLIDHLKLIEQQIQRMADNSFKVKNWALTVVGGALLYWLKEEYDMALGINCNGYDYLLVA